MAQQRTKTRRTKGRARKARPISVRARDRKTGRVYKVGADRAYELFIGGVTGLWSLAHQLKMPDKIGAALLLVLSEGVKVATPKALLAVYRSLGGKPLPSEAVILADVSRETPRGTRRRKSPQLPATPRRSRG
jgi:hypothetical protein